MRPWYAEELFVDPEEAIDMKPPIPVAEGAVSSHSEDDRSPPELGVAEIETPNEESRKGKKRQIHFIYSNPEENLLSQPGAGVDDSNIRIVYLAAAAQAEDSDEETGTPRKVRLLYAEALGYGGNGVDPPQLIYAAATPNQHITSDDQSIYAAQPRFIDTPADWNFTPERVQDMFAQQPPTNMTPLPMQLITHTSGSSFGQSFADYPENMNILQGARDIPDLMPREHQEPRRETSDVFAEHGFYAPEIPLIPTPESIYNPLFPSHQGFGLLITASNLHADLIASERREEVRSIY